MPRLEAVVERAGWGKRDVEKLGGAVDYGVSRDGGLRKLFLDKVMPNLSCRGRLVDLLVTL